MGLVSIHSGGHKQRGFQRHRWGHFYMYTCCRRVNSWSQNCDFLWQIVSEPFKHQEYGIITTVLANTKNWGQNADPWIWFHVRGWYHNTGKHHNNNGAEGLMNFRSWMFINNSAKNSEILKIERNGQWQTAPILPAPLFVVGRESCIFWNTRIKVQIKYKYKFK